MKRFTWLLLGLAVVVLATSPILAAQKAGKGKRSKGGSDAMRGEYAIMASQCELSDQQKTDLGAKVKARKEAQAAWQQANGEKYKALREAQKKAKEANDKDAMKKARDDLKALDAGRRKIDADTMAAIYAVLTPEQCQAWEGFKIYRGLMGRYSKAELDEGQKAKVRALANEAAKKMLAVEGTGKEAEEAKNKIEQELKASIENDVLTAEQKEKLTEKQPARTDTGSMVPKKNESTPLPTQDQKDVAPDEVSSHRVLYQEGVDVTIVKDGKPVTERIAVYGVAGLRFPARTLAVDRRAKLTTTVIIIEAAKGGFLVPEKDSAVPVNMGFDESAKFGLSFFTHAINTTWKFAKPGIRFYAGDSIYESERAGASISFTEDGVKMDGLRKIAGK